MNIKNLFFHVLFNSDKWDITEETRVTDKC